jgi:hypothetical protein
MRIRKGYQIIDVPSIMKVVKIYYQNKMTYLINNNKKLANNFYVDNNHIGQQLAIKLLLSLFKMVFILFNFSYFIGMTWIIILKILKDIDERIYGPGSDKCGDDVDSNVDGFLAVYCIDKKS